MSLQQHVLDLLNNFRGAEPMKELFWSRLNYDRVNQPLSTRGWTDNAAQPLAEDPVLFASGGDDDGFHVVYSPSQVRPVVPRRRATDRLPPAAGSPLLPLRLLELRAGSLALRQCEVRREGRQAPPLPPHHHRPGGTPPHRVGTGRATRPGRDAQCHRAGNPATA